MYSGILRGKTPVRCYLNDILSDIDVSDPVLDIGGGHGWEYHDSLQTGEDTVVVNLAGDMEVDLLADAERTLPFVDDSFETVLCLNTIQYLYDYDVTISEATRVLREGGQFLLAVPFLQLVSGHPVDYQRFTEQRLRRELSEFSDVTVWRLSPGPFAAAAYQLHPIVKSDGLRYLLWQTATGVDRLAGQLSETYSETIADAYPLYLVVEARL